MSILKLAAENAYGMEKLAGWGSLRREIEALPDESIRESTMKIFKDKYDLSVRDVHNYRHTNPSDTLSFNNYRKRYLTNRLGLARTEYRITQLTDRVNRLKNKIMTMHNQAPSAMIAEDAKVNNVMRKVEPLYKADLATNTDDVIRRLHRGRIAHQSAIANAAVAAERRSFRNAAKVIGGLGLAGTVAGGVKKYRAAQQAAKLRRAGLAGLAATAGLGLGAAAYNSLKE